MGELVAAGHVLRPRPSAGGESGVEHQRRAAPARTRSWLIFCRNEYSSCGGGAGRGRAGGDQDRSTDRRPSGGAAATVRRRAVEIAIRAASAPRAALLEAGRRRAAALGAWRQGRRVRLPPPFRPTPPSPMRPPAPRLVAACVLLASLAAGVTAGAEELPPGFTDGHPVGADAVADGPDGLGHAEPRRGTAAVTERYFGAGGLRRRPRRGRRHLPHLHDLRRRAHRPRAGARVQGVVGRHHRRHGARRP